MGSKSGRFQASPGEKMVQVSTAELRIRLNRLYNRMRSASGQGDLGRFDYLWDLKELALMEGRPTVDVPETWLDEMEKGFGGHVGQQGH